MGFRTYVKRVPTQSDIRWDYQTYRLTFANINYCAWTIAPPRIVLNWISKRKFFLRFAADYHTESGMYSEQGLWKSIECGRLYCVIMYASHGTPARTRVTGYATTVGHDREKWVEVGTFLPRVSPRMRNTVRGHYVEWVMTVREEVQKEKRLVDWLGDSRTLCKRRSWHNE